MTRRWLVSCGALVLMGTSLAAAATGQSPTSLAERIKQLRRDWTEDDDAPIELSAAEQPTSAAPIRAGSAQLGTPASSVGRGGLPQIDPRSLLPSSMRGSDDRYGATPSSINTSQSVPRRSISSPPVSTQPVAAKSPSILGSGATTPSYSTARRSPPQRPPVDFESGALHDALVSTSPTIATTSAPTQAALQGEATSPTILDDFAAGLAKGVQKPAETATNTQPTVKPTTQSGTSRGPITLPATPQPTVNRSLAPPAEPEPTLAEEEDRYRPSPTPALETVHAPTPAMSAAPSHVAPPNRTNSASGRIAIGGGQNPDAAKAFENIPAPAATNSPIALETLPVVPRGALTGDAAEASRESFNRNESEPAAVLGVLVTNQAPSIVSDIRGPKQIAIGRQATYRVRLQNQGGSGADAMVATVRIPSWAEVVDTTATNGAVRQTAADNSATLLQWQIARLDAQSTEILSIDLIPRASRPLELGVSWTHDPVNTRTIVEVQEPKLQLDVSGPDEVLFGKSHVYRLTLANPGTGVAENVRIQLLPPGGGAEAVSTFEVGNLAPGETKTAEVELTAREAGKLSVQAVATAAGDLKSQASKELFCRKPELEVDWRGPETQYAGTAATYFFRVRNPGTAAADDVAVKVNLPVGAEFVSASEGHVFDKTNREVAWRVGSLGPGDDCYMELRCTVSTPGENKIAVTAATAAGDLTDNKFGVTNVIALADLKLDVRDPSGPVAVGEEAIYEIRVTNRGAGAAEDVNVVGLFSAGLEPEVVEGAPYSVSDGRVAFKTVSKLAAGQEIELQIRARATEAGTHVFRAEVLCRDLEIKLAAEETTRFYDSQISRDPPATPQSAVGVSYQQEVAR